MSINIIAIRDPNQPHSQIDTRVDSRRRRGTALVEFAVVAPVFFMFTFACIEFARVNMLRNTAEIAATEAARAGVIPGATAGDCLAAANGELAVLGVSGHSVAVTPDPLTSAATTVRVAVDVPLTVANGYVITQFFVGKTVRASVELRREK